MSKASPLGERSELSYCHDCQGSGILGTTSQHCDRCKGSGFIRNSDQPPALAKATDDGQEWTAEDVEQILDDAPTKDNACRRLSDAFNAELAAAYEKNEEPRCDFVSHIKLEQNLAAERQRREQAEHWLGELLAVIHCDGGHYQAEHGIEKATNDAIEKRNKLVARIDVIEQRLLSALAAIAEALQQLSTMNDFMPSRLVAVTLRAVDLSALHKHDAEVRKPLVDALKLLANDDNYMEPSFNPATIASNVLAKVKP